jgi:hypothetical protein
MALPSSLSDKKYKSYTGYQDQSTSKNCNAIGDNWNATKIALDGTNEDSTKLQDNTKRIIVNPNETDIQIEINNTASADQIDSDSFLIHGYDKLEEFIGENLRGSDGTNDVYIHTKASSAVDVYLLER